MAGLTEKRCKPCEGGLDPLSPEVVGVMLTELAGWVREDNTIRKTYSSKNYYETMAFVNAVAYVSHQEDHHPDMLVSYKACAVVYTTHAIGGLSENDFICAAKIDALD